MSDWKRNGTPGSMISNEMVKEREPRNEASEERSEGAPQGEPVKSLGREFYGEISDDEELTAKEIN